MDLRTTTAYEEDLIVNYACALAKLARPEETVQVPSVGDRAPREMSRQLLAEVVEPRYEELFTLVLEDLRRSGFEHLLAAGIVLTGGTSKMEGVTELAEEIFHMPVRVGAPVNVSGLADIVKNPVYSTGVGLLHYAKLEYEQRKDIEKSESSASSFFSSVTSWVQGDL